VDFRVLGPIGVVVNGDRTVPVGHSKQRCLLAMLVLEVNQVVPVERLIAGVWGDEPPVTVRNLVSGYVARLRRAFAGAGLGTGQVWIGRRSTGYVLETDAASVDLHRFRQLVARARASTEDTTAAAAFRDALDLWRGTALIGAEGAWLGRVRDALEDERLSAQLDCYELELRLGRHAQLVGELAELVARHPLHEELVRQLMLALYGSGRVAEALDCYWQLRRRSVEELGTDPRAELSELQQRMLNGDRTLASHEPPAAPAPTPPTAADRSVPAQLPHDVRVFTGRSAELRVLDGGLNGGLDQQPGRSPVIDVITGMAGVGKTALAVHWAHRVADRFPDGQLYVDLRGDHPSLPPVDAGEALLWLLRALGTDPARIPASVPERVALYRSVLAARRMLVVLDNAVTAEQVRPLLPGSPSARVVLTSRHRLDGLVALDGARSVELDVLPDVEATALLAELVADARAVAEPDELLRLARLCGNLPLALRLAAAILARQPDRPITHLVAELTTGDPLSTLAVPGDPRASVRAAVDLSYRKLGSDQRRLFRLLGLVPGPTVCAPAAAALCGASTQRAVRLLDALAEAHLVERREPGRFTLHDLLRRYAKGRAERDEPAQQRAEAGDRLFDWYVQTADRAARILQPGMLRLPTDAGEKPSTGAAGRAAPAVSQPFASHATALAWLDAERANLVAVATYCARYGPHSVAWRLADALRGYFLLRGHPAEWVAVAQAGLAAAETHGDAAARAAAELCFGLYLFSCGQYGAATERYEAMLRLARRAGWHEAEAAALLSLGNSSHALGRLQAAADHYAAAAQVRRAGGLGPGSPPVVSYLGIAYWQLGRLTEAADCYVEALAHDRAAGRPDAEAVDLTNLGGIYHDLGRLDAASGLLTDALARHRQLGSRSGEASTREVLAGVERDAGRLESAEGHVRVALDLAREIADRRIEGAALKTAASIELARSNPGAALRHYRAALEVVRGTGAVYPEAETLIGIATAHLLIGDPAAVLKPARQALDIGRAESYRLLEGQANGVLGEAYLELGELEPALACAERAFALHRDTGHRLGAAKALHLLDRVRGEARSGRRAAAAGSDNG
jgi:DNA-binding SARP family transcriptional activator/tetratricopeptide (TPR) repeat protein